MVGLGRLLGPVEWTYLEAKLSRAGGLKGNGWFVRPITVWRASECRPSPA